MKRRFLISSLGLALVSLRSYASQIVTPQKPTSSDPSRMKVQNILLKSGQTFQLPLSPVDGDIITFTTEGDCLKMSAVIRGQGQPILGQKEDLEVDINGQFSLVFSQSHQTWGLV